MDVYFANNIILSRYIKIAQDNWDNFTSENDFISNILDNDILKSDFLKFLIDPEI